MRYKVWTLILLVMVLSACDIIDTQQQVIVQNNEVGVLMDTETGELGAPLPPGTYTIDPLHQKVTFYPTFTQNYMFSSSNTGMETVTASPAVDAQTLDGKAVKINLSVVFRIDPTAVNQIHSAWNGAAGDYRAGYIRPTTRLLVRTIVSTFDWPTLTAMLPGDLASRIETPLREELADNGFILERVDVLRVEAS